MAATSAKKNARKAPQRGAGIVRVGAGVVKAQPSAKKRVRVAPSLELDAQACRLVHSVDEAPDGGSTPPA